MPRESSKIEARRRVRKGIRRYVSTLFALIGTTLLVSAGLNLWVNPWRLAPAITSSAAFDPWRDMGSQIRTAKCGMTRSAPSIGVALLGSSRVANALDPLALDWRRGDVYNLACPAGYLYETSAFFHYLLRHHHPDLVIIGLDPDDILSRLDTRGMGDFSASPLSSAHFRLDREIRYLVGISTLEESFTTIRRRARDIR